MGERDRLLAIDLEESLGGRRSSKPVFLVHVTLLSGPWPTRTRRPVALIRNIRTVFVVPLQLVEATHLRVTCDACRAATAEVCGKRDRGDLARAAAVRKFRAVGWHHNPGRVAASARAEKEAETSGSGRWYCPTCVRREKHGR